MDPGGELRWTSTYTDKDRLLAKTPIYVNILSPSCNILQIGSYFFPYCQLQNALNAGGLNNGVLVMEQGAYTMTQGSINANVEMVTRSGQSSVDHGAQLWILPVDFSDSPSPEVRRNVRTAQDEDTAERNLSREAKVKAAKAATPAERAAVKAEARAGIKLHQMNARTRMEEAEKFADGDEKLSIRFELARRYSQEGDCTQAERYYTLVAEGTDQKYLREEALRRAKKCWAEQKAAPAQRQPGKENTKWLLP